MKVKIVTPRWDRPPPQYAAPGVDEIDYHTRGAIVQYALAPGDSDSHRDIVAGAAEELVALDLRDDTWYEFDFNAINSNNPVSFSVSIFNKNVLWWAHARSRCANCAMALFMHSKDKCLYEPTSFDFAGARLVHSHTLSMFNLTQKEWEYFLTLEQLWVALHDGEL